MFALVILLAAASVAADAVAAAQAQKAFQQGLQAADNPSRARELFHQAADKYALLASRGYRNPALYQNLGNARLLADELPQAILAYRRGLRLAPNDWTLRQNLAHACSLVAYPTSDLGHPPVDPLPPWWPRVGSGLFLATALIAYVAACIALTRWRMTRRSGSLAVGLVLLLTAVFAGGFGGWLAWGEQVDVEHPLVVIADDGVLLRSGNGLSYPPRYETSLNRGVEARRLQKRGDWLKIELAGGETGWVPRPWVLVDEPEQ